MSHYHINADIHKAETLPSSFYQDRERFQSNTDTLLSASWQFIGDQAIIDGENNVVPFTLNEGIANEPVVITKDRHGEVRCLSNVCTHRGNLLITEKHQARHLVCGYHGRKFSLGGEFEFMPEFEAAEDFPRACDHLQQIPMVRWKQFYFVSLQPKFTFDAISRELNKRLGFLEVEKLKYNPASDRTYQVRAHWALYCDNYLEGFHIPFVHPGLNQAVEYNSYETILQQYASLQIGYAREGVEAFDLPADHPDFGKQVAAYYYWIFPNLMLNFYPWGLSVNIVKPKSISETEVVFKSYELDTTKRQGSAGAALNEVELEDEAVVEAVQKGMQSRFYKSGRFSPTKEKGVHHFHSLIAKFLSTDG